MKYDAKEILKLHRMYNCRIQTSGDRKVYILHGVFTYRIKKILCKDWFKCYVYWTAHHCDI